MVPNQYAQPPRSNRNLNSNSAFATTSISISSSTCVNCVNFEHDRDGDI